MAYYPLISVKNILVLADLSDHAEYALMFAREFGPIYRAACTCCTCWICIGFPRQLLIPGACLPIWFRGAKRKCRHVSTL